MHCVIIGFALHDTDRKIIYDYENIKGEAHALEAKNINPYLVDASDIVLGKQTKPICLVPEMKFGNQPIDGGNLLFTAEGKATFLNEAPAASKYFRRFVGAEEFINKIERWCLWLKGAQPEELRKIPAIMNRLEKVRQFRLSSKRPATNALASTPTLFAFISHPEGRYLLVPSVSSERRAYIPIGFMSPEAIASNLCLIIPHATLFHFGVLSSVMHMAWTRAVAGRLKSDYRYSGSIVYNNFPWPSEPTEKQRLTIEQAAQTVLDSRAAHPDASLADLYDPVAMPPDLRRAHQALDKAVDAAYAGAGFKPAPTKSDAERVAFLFELYHKYTSMLPAPKAPVKKRRKI